MVEGAHGGGFRREAVHVDAGLGGEYQGKDQGPGGHGRGDAVGAVLRDGRIAGLCGKAAGSQEFQTEGRREDFDEHVGEGGFGHREDDAGEFSVSFSCVFMVLSHDFFIYRPPCPSSMQSQKGISLKLCASSHTGEANVLYV